jgi:cytosine/adenosine deaminase-related metal-dependent hydrolase
MATRSGAAALGINAGTIAPGSLADFTRIDLDAPNLRAITPTHLATAIITGS